MNTLNLVNLIPGIRAWYEIRDHKGKLLEGRLVVFLYMTGEDNREKEYHFFDCYEKVIIHLSEERAGLLTDDILEYHSSHGEGITITRWKSY